MVDKSIIKDLVGDIANAGIAFSGIFGYIFIALKLTGCIDWSWRFVILAGFAISPLIILTILILSAFVFATTVSLKGK